MSDVAEARSSPLRANAMVKDEARKQPPQISIDAADAALFLDLDGTLAEFASHPSAVGPDPRRSDLLRRLADMLEGRIAVVSGRTIEDVDRILENALPNVAGVHGLERRTAGVPMEITLQNVDNLRKFQPNLQNWQEWLSQRRTVIDDHLSNLRQRDSRKLK